MAAIVVHVFSNFCNKDNKGSQGVMQPLTTVTGTALKCTPLCFLLLTLWHLNFKKLP